MTDARFPERWLSDRRLQRLSDGHFRAFVTSLAWSVSNRTDGVIEPEDLGLIPNFAANSVQAFVNAELWAPLANGWLIKEYAVTQTSRDQLTVLENVRARDREKKARQRARKAAAGSGDSADVPGTVPGDVPPENTGQARPGQDRRSKGNGPSKLAAVSSSSKQVVNGHPEWRGAGPDPFQEYN